MSGIELKSRLASLRQRMLRIAGGAGAGWALGAAAAVLVVCMWLDLALELPAQLRIGSVAVAGACMVVVLAQVLVLTLRRSREMALARRLDESAAAGGQVLAGVDLMLSGADCGGAPVTAGLAQMAIARAADIVNGTRAEKIAPLRPLYAPGAVLLLMAGILGLVAMLAPRLVTQQWRRFMHPFAAHPPYSPLVFEISPGDARVPYGSSLDIRAAITGGAVDRVELVLRPDDQSAEEAIPMFPQPDGSWRSTLTNVTSPTRYYVRAQRARSYGYSIQVITLPKIESVKYRVTHPPYTHLPAYEGPLPQGGLAGLPRTKVEVWAKADRPLGNGTIQWVAATTTTQPSSAAQSAMPPLQLVPAGEADTVYGSFEISANARGSLAVFDQEGRQSRESVTIPVTLLSDARPFVRILLPPAQSYATPDAQIPVQIAAEDDYGIGRLQLYRSLNDSRAIPMDMPVPENNPTKLSAETKLPLAAYQLRVGDTIKLYARVEDTDPDGPKGSESSVVTIEIKSPEELAQREIEEMGLDALTSKYAEARRHMEQAVESVKKLDEEMKKVEPAEEIAPDKLKDLEALARELQKHAGAIDDLSKEKLPLDLDKFLNKELGPMAEALKAASGDAKTLAGNKPSGAVADKELEAIAKRLAKELGEFDQAAMIPLELLEKIYPLIEDSARFVLLYQWQRDLEQRLASLKGSDQPDDPAIKARMRDLEGEQQRIQDELITLLDDIDAHIKLVPDEEQFLRLKETAKEFVLGVRGSGARKKMAEAVAALTEFRGTPAYEAAKEAADILEKFISKCKSMGGEAGNCPLVFAPSLAQAMGNTIGQLLGMRSGGNGSGLMGQVGIFGRMPVSAWRRGSGQGRNSNASGGMVRRGDGGEQNPAEGPARAGAVRGQGGGHVPVQYKLRVDAYFDRIADELGNR